MSIPKNNVNLCFVGGVSTGKSTGLNGVFCQKLTDCKIKRTTMVPTVYVEHETGSIGFSSEEIFQEISNKNKILIEKTENSVETTDSDYKELVFHVGKLDMKILDGAYVNIYDIPGLNDARTKNIYYSYLEKQFHLFNVILFYVDINSGLNTSDEMDILKFIASRTASHRKNNRKVYTLVIVNKADDMQLNSDDELVLIGEMEEMFNQVVSTVNNEFKQHDIEQQLLGIIPFCALDAYLYRMVKKYGENFKLTPQQIQKIGVNEMGKKFSTYKPDIQEQKVYEILKDQDFIDSMIQLSGFSSLENILKKCMLTDGLGRQLQIDNLIQELSTIPELNENMMCLMWSKRNKTSIEILDKQHEIYTKIREIDEPKYFELLQKQIEHVKKLSLAIIETQSLLNIVEKYDHFVSTYIAPYFSEVYDITSYPDYFIKTILKRLNNECFTIHLLPVGNIDNAELEEEKDDGIQMEVRNDSIRSHRVDRADAVFERPQVFSSNTKIYKSYSRGLHIRGAGFPELPSKPQLRFSPSLVEGTDYNIEVIDRTELEVTLLDGRSWRSDSGPLLVTAINTRGDESGWVTLPGEGIHVAEIAEDRGTPIKFIKRRGVTTPPAEPKKSMSLVRGFHIIKLVGLWNTETITQTIQTIIKNPYGFKSIQVDNQESLIELLREIESLETPLFKQFIRFLLLCRYSYDSMSTDVYHKRIMLYKSYREVPICHYLLSKQLNYPSTASIDTYLDISVKPDETEYVLDMFYLEREYLHT